ncbi:hypothetical protein AUR64_16765 [Haloprofundus marisrubri]|uniref:DUF4013 domain-containing protein n=1 Tax=Haloprofundus marisrubri TaxID=1514971 RepID=A0A0W1R9R1_9EURY|nr:DUF4013 domain-containing protein [Haloprofundus marisrubri]KTG09429.1 hypothetical protein AUR64_16765 [Haloprofundus marisrubri]
MNWERFADVVDEENPTVTVLFGVLLAAMQTTLSTVLLLGYVSPLFRDESPGFTDWRRLLGDGVRGFVVWFGWSAVPLAILVVWYQAHLFTTWVGGRYADTSTYLASVLGTGATGYEARIVFEAFEQLFGGVAFQWILGEPGQLPSIEAIAALETRLLVAFLAASLLSLYLFPASFARVAATQSIRAALGWQVARTVFRVRYVLLWPVLLLAWVVGVAPEAIWLVWKRSPALAGSVTYEIASVQVPFDFQLFVLDVLPVGVVPTPSGILEVTALLVVSALRFGSLVAGYAILRRAVRIPEKDPARNVTSRTDSTAPPDPADPTN